MSNDSNPYEASQTSTSGDLSLQQKLLAIAVGGVVTVAAAFTMLAFLFGIMIALAGRSMPSPISFSALLSSSMGHWFVAGAAGTLPISILLGVFSLFRVLRVQRSLMDTAARRHDLERRMNEMRQSRPSK